MTYHEYTPTATLAKNTSQTADIAFAISISEVVSIKSSGWNPGINQIWWSNSIGTAGGLQSGAGVRINTTGSASISDWAPNTNTYYARPCIWVQVP